MAQQPEPRETGIKKLPDGRWEVLVSFSDRGKMKWRRRRIKGTLKDAREAREALRTDLRRGVEEQRSSGQKLSGYIESWLRSRALRVRMSTASEYGTVLAHAEPELGHLPVHSIRPRDVQEWFDEMTRLVRAGEISATTANNRLRVLRMCLGDACAELGIPNPALRVRRLPEPAPERCGLTVEELRAFRDAYDHEETKALVETLILTGMRWGEASALRWDDIDTERRIIHVRRSHRFNVLGKPKGGRTRVVPLCSVLADVLQEHRQKLLADQDEGMEAGWCFATVTKRGPNMGAVRLRTPSSVQKAWKKVCKKTGVVAKPHDLRRTFVDLLRQAEVDAVVEHAIVGHADEKMREHYSTVRPPEANEAMNRVVKLVVGD